MHYVLLLITYNNNNKNIFIERIIYIVLYVPIYNIALFTYNIYYYCKLHM